MKRCPHCQQPVDVTINQDGSIDVDPSRSTNTREDDGTHAAGMDRLFEALGLTPDHDRKYSTVVLAINDLKRELAEAIERNAELSRQWSESDQCRAIMDALDKGTRSSSANGKHEALVFFIAQAFADGFFDDDPVKEEVRAWLLEGAQSIRDDLTVADVLGSIFNKEKAHG